MLLLVTTCLIGNGYTQTCPDGMVSFWKFDDTSTELFIDSYGTHDAESENSVATVTEGKVYAAKYLSGTNVIMVSDHNDFDFPANSSFSIECWVQFSDPDFGNPQVIIGKRDSQASGAYWFIGIEKSTGKAIFEVQGTGDTYQEIKSSAGLSLNVWHHIVGVRDESTNTNKLYVDGSLAASVTYDYTGSFSSNGSILIGAFPNSSGIPAYFYQGNIDETAIYNRALTQAEITEHLLKNNNGIGYCDGFSPSIKSTPVNTAVVGQQYIYTPYATGMPTINYTLVTGPDDMVIEDGVITWTPASTDINAWVEIRANNGYVPADTQKFRIYLAEAPVCPEGISVLLKLDENSGPTYIDYYNAHHSTATVAPVATTGIVNGGQSFSATTGIDIPDNADEFEWTQTSDFSIEFWMKTSVTSTMVIVGRHRKADDNPERAKWWVGTDGSGYATFSLQDNNETPKLFEISGETALSDNIWHHIIAVRDGSSQQNRLYVDGIRVAAVTTDYGNSFRADVPTEISVGYWKRAYVGDNEYHYTGALDEVAIFDKAINDAEAAAFFNLRAPVGHCAISNYVPVFTSVPVEEATEDVQYTYTFTVEDIDATDLISLSAPTKPTWLQFNYVTGQKTATLTATPTNSEVGDHDVVLEVYDGTDTKQQSFTITVENVNDAPVVTSTAVESAIVNELYAYVFTATDVDNPTITLSSVTIPGWLSFNPENGILSGTPALADKGQHVVTLRASDGDLSVEQSFTIVVTGPTGLEDLEAEGISLYPVPAGEYLVVEFANNLDETNLEIVGANGSILKRAIVPAGQDYFRIDLNNVESGTYYLHISNKMFNSIGRFVIIK
ncbi:MAG: putative Ig domain-containing protein [Bacteroidales bacterium]|nr:putative Ig domain-containing protein [Bacteroidales bacterium]